MDFSNLWAAWLQIKAANETIAQERRRSADLEVELAQAQAELSMLTLPDAPQGEPTLVEFPNMRDIILSQYSVDPQQFKLNNAFRVWPEEEVDRFFRESYVGRESYVQDWHNCKNFAFEDFVNLSRWGGNGIVFVGDSPIGFHAWSGALVVRNAAFPGVSRILCKAYEPQTGQPITDSRYVPVWPPLVNG